MGKLLEVKEYDSITCNENFKNDPHYKFLDEASFLELENMILSFKNGEETDAIEFFILTSRRDVGKIIRAKNYVGIVQLKNSTQIQIIPKIDACEIVDSKRIFLRMLRSMRDFPSKIFNETNLKLEHLNLYDIFIKIYIQEVSNLVKKGIISAYYPINGNVNIYKGKLVFNEHIKRNIVHKERFYMNFDEFGVNRAENKLIKATLMKLMKITSSSENIKNIRQLLSNFEMINASKNYDKDFAQVIIDRSTKDYQNIMRWSKVFLMNKGFTTFSGDSSAAALLFPMEKLFEAYVGKSLQKELIKTDWNISLQDRGHYLFESQFALKPDIVVEKNDKSRKIILDTKWKLLTKNRSSNYGIAQSDMYQMYAYAKKYKTNEIWLLYPINNEMMNIGNIQFISEDNVIVKVFFIDVSDVYKSIKELIELWNE